MPRDEAYYGDPGTIYIYSRREYKPLACIPGITLLEDSGRMGPTPGVAYSNSSLKSLGYNAVLCGRHYLHPPGQVSTTDIEIDHS